MKNDQQNYWQPQDEAEAPSQAPRNNEASERQTKPAPVLVGDDQVPPDDIHVPDEISWEASEVIEHSRGPLWYIAFGIIVLALVGVMVYFQQWTFAVLIFVMAVAVIVMMRRPPRILHYTANHAGLIIDDKMHNYAEYRAFGLIRDDALFAIKLIPVKRFSPETMVYFAEKDGEVIMDILGSHLPMEEMKLDIADRIIRKIRL